MNPDSAHPRVCVVISTFFPYVGGGETHARLLCREMIRLGADVSVITRRTSPELPKRDTTNFLAAIVKDTASVVAGEDAAQAELEKRPLFEEISAAGQLALGPEPSGWVKSSISSLELGAFKGTVESFNVIIEGGTLDSGVAARFRPGGELDVDTQTVLTELSMTEPENGLIRRHLKLPAPLDVALFILRDADGAITLPVGFALEDGKPSLAALGAEFIAVLGGLILDAIQASPFRLAQSMLEVAGLSADMEPPEETDQTVRVLFTAGDAHMTLAEEEKLEALAEQLRADDQLHLRVGHEVGAADIERARVFANPSRAECEELITRLRQRRGELERAADDLAIGLRDAVRRSDAGVEKLREESESIHRELGVTENALDQVYDLLRPGSERQAPRRLRKACVTLAELRLERVYRALLVLDVPDIERRVEQPTPRFRQPSRDGGGAVSITPVVQQSKAPEE